MTFLFCEFPTNFFTRFFEHLIKMKENFKNFKENNQLHTSFFFLLTAICMRCFQITKIYYLKADWRYDLNVNLTEGKIGVKPGGHLRPFCPQSWVSSSLFCLRDLIWESFLSAPAGKFSWKDRGKNWLSSSLYLRLFSFIS
jgi:hypothetical protein